MNKRTVKGIFFAGLAVIFLLGGILFFTLQNQEREPYQIIFIPKTIDPDNGFWTALIGGAELGAQEFGAEIQVLGGKTEEDIEGQISTIEAAIEKKPDVLLVAPGSYSETTQVLKKVRDSGIPLILIDSVIDEDIADAIVSTDNYLMGKELGEFSQTLVTGNPKIGLMVHVKGASTAMEREQGIRDGLGEYEKCIADTRYCDSSYEKSYEQTQSMLTEYPDLEMIIATNEYGAVGAARAVKDMGLADKVKLVGVDSSVEEIQLLEEGIFQAIIIQKPFNMGYLGVEQAVKLLDKKGVENHLDSGCKLITKENLYEEENQRLLYPFTGQQ